MRCALYRNTKRWYHHATSFSLILSRERQRGSCAVRPFSLSDTSGFKASTSQRSTRSFAPLTFDVPPKRIVFGSCSSQKEDLSYWDQISALSPDLVLLMGDNVYGRTDGLPHAYATLSRHASFQKAAQSIPIIATLDDNDYECHPHGMDAAKEIFLDFFQAPSTDIRRTANRGVFHSYVWGGDDATTAANRLQLICLDVRYYKSPFLQVADPSNSEAGPYVSEYNTNVHSTMLGAKQWQWLEEQLRLDNVGVRIICSPIQVLAQGHGWDCWNLFPHERNRLIRLVTKSQTFGTTACKTIILSGDRHVGAYYQKDGLFEVTSSSLTHTVPSGLLDHEFDATRTSDFVHVNNFGMLDIDWKQQHDTSTGDAFKKLEVSIRRADNGQAVGEAWTRQL